MQGLFSVVINCYQRFEFIYEAIDSVLAQDYPEIELIVSDDGSENFPREELMNYIEAHKKKNIVRVTIRQEPENCGTVKHLNHAFKLCAGEYVTGLAGDDVFAGESVLTKYWEGFSNAGDNCCIEMAQVGIYDITLTKLDGYCPSHSTQKAIEHTTESTDELLRHLVQYGACLPTTSTCYKKEFFSRFGQFDEGYRLIDDVPMHFRLAKEGWVIHYEDFVATKHRDGGISHSKHRATAQSYIAYYKDSAKGIKELILDNIDVLPPEQAKQVRYYREKELRWLDYQLAVKRNGRWGILKVMLKNPSLAMKVGMDHAYSMANRIKKGICCAFSCG